jgi:hypothetical protein
MAQEVLHDLLGAHITAGDLLKNPMFQGFLANATLQFLRAVGKALDGNPAVKTARPYLELAVVIMTVLVSIIKAVLSGDAEHAPWDALISSVLFFIGAKSIPADGIDDVGRKSVATVQAGIKSFR